MITLTIDGIEVTVKQGATILEAARQAGVRIPTLCHDERLIPFGACRLCVVELEGRAGRLVPACFNPARNGMVVHTHTPAVVEARKMQLQLILRHHPLDCPVCEAGGRCELQNLVHEYGLEDLPFPREAPVFPVDLRSHFIKRDMNRCILCGCCVRICNEVQGVNEISFVKRGIRTEIGTDFGRPLDCEFCGQCVSTCPVGALANKPLGPIARAWEVTRTETVCAYCGLGCALVLEAKDGKIIQVSSSYDLGPNEGNLCVKGRYGWTYVHSDKRLLRPLIRDGERLVEATWEAAIQRVAERWKEIRREAGPEALAVLGSARLTNEEAYMLQRLARGIIGTPHVDHGAGLAYSALLDGLRPVLGYAAATNGIRQIRDADVILAIRADFKQTHPVAKNQVVLASGRRKAKVVVVDHVRTSLCDLPGSIALLVPPGSEGLVIRGMIRTIVEEGWWDREFVEARTEGLESLREAVAPYDLSFVAERTGLDPDAIRTAAKEFAQSATACILMGLETLPLGDGVDLARAAACLALLTAKVGKPGCGLHIYGERANSQGALDMGLVPGLLPGYLSPEDPEARKRFEDAWRTSIPVSRGLGARAILEGCLEGKIRSLYIVGENPMGTYPQREWVRDALGSVEFLVVQEIFPTETALMAHVVLPVASFAEKRGTFTSVDRRVQGLNAALAPPEGVRSDLEVFGALIQAMGWPSPHGSPEGVLEEIGRLVQLYEGIRCEDIPPGGLPWPLIPQEAGVGGTDVLYQEDFPHGRARLELGPWEEKEPEGDAREFPLVLTPRAVWFHNGSFSTWSPSLMEVCPGPWIILHDEDARAAGLKEGERARVVTPRGVVEGEVRVRDRGPRGVVQVPHHFSDQPVNALVDWEGRPVRARVEGVG